MDAFNYIVAGHLFTVQNAGIPQLEEMLSHYAPFRVETLPAERPVFVLNVVPVSELPVPDGLVEEFNQDDDGSQIRLSRTPSGCMWFDFCLWDSLAGSMMASPSFDTATLVMHEHSDFALNNALMVMYAMSTARKGTALFHAAVIGYEGRGYLFLGKSGTGKSTHARLWLKNISGSELVNDDNPVVRVLPDGTVRVYGSPWSGKTPCYRNMDLPAGAFVQLAQAPYNAIRRLKGIGAYAALVPSISGMRWERSLADGVHETEDTLAGTVPVWHLDCLPDSAAALLCMENVTKA